MRGEAMALIVGLVANGVTTRMAHRAMGKCYATHPVLVKELFDGTRLIHGIPATQSIFAQAIMLILAFTSAMNNSGCGVLLFLGVSIPVLWSAAIVMKISRLHPDVSEYLPPQFDGAPALEHIEQGDGAPMRPLDPATGQQLGDTDSVDGINEVTPVDEADRSATLKFFVGLIIVLFGHAVAVHTQDSLVVTDGPQCKFYTLEVTAAAVWILTMMSLVAASLARAVRTETRSHSTDICIAGGVLILAADFVELCFLFSASSSGPLWISAVVYISILVPVGMQAIWWQTYRMQAALDTQRNAQRRDEILDRFFDVAPARRQDSAATADLFAGDTPPATTTGRGARLIDIDEDGSESEQSDDMLVSVSGATPAPEVPVSVCFTPADGFDADAVTMPTAGGGLASQRLTNIIASATIGDRQRDSARALDKARERAEMKRTIALSRDSRLKGRVFGAERIHPRTWAEAVKNRGVLVPLRAFLSGRFATDNFDFLVCVTLGVSDAGMVRVSVVLAIFKKFFCKDPLNVSEEASSKAGRMIDNFYKEPEGAVVVVDEENNPFALATEEVAAMFDNGLMGEFTKSPEFTGYANGAVIYEEDIKRITDVSAILGLADQ